MNVREGSDRLIELANAASPSLALDPAAEIPIERELPPPHSEGPQTFTHENVMDGVEDDDFLMDRLGMGYQPPMMNSPGAPPMMMEQQSLPPLPPPPQPQPQPQNPAVAPLTEKEIYSKKIEYIWILRRLRGGDPNFPIPKVTDDLYKIEMLVEQVRRENACQDGVETCKFALMFFSGALESAAGRAPLNRWLHLKGYSKKLMMDVESDRRYEEAMIALSNKYRAKMPSSPELMLGFLIAQSAISYSVASQMTDAALGSMQIQAPPPPAPTVPVVPVPTPPPPAAAAPAGPALATQPEQLAEIMRILQQRQMHQPPPIPQSPTASGSSGSQVSESSRSESSRSSSSSGKRKRQAKPSSSSKRRRRPAEEDWESASSEEESSSDDDDQSSIPVNDVRRRIPAKFKNRRHIASSVETSPPPAPPPTAAVPVVDVRLQARGGRGRGGARARGGVRGGAARRPTPTATTTEAAQPAPPPPASEADEDTELDMRSVG